MLYGHLQSIWTVNVSKHENLYNEYINIVFDICSSGTLFYCCIVRASEGEIVAQGVRCYANNFLKMFLLQMKCSLKVHTPYFG